MTSENWLTGLLVLALFQSINFFRLAFATGVFSVFGRRTISSSSFAYLGLMAMVPSLSLIPYFAGPFPLTGIDAAIENSLILASTTVASHTLMEWISMGINIPNSPD